MHLARLPLRCNVDLLKLIQIGLCLTNEHGELPTVNGELCLWQFNFREFRLADDLYAQDSIDLLRQSGINFAQNEARGIEVQQFGELLMSSGIVLNEEVRYGCLEDTLWGVMVYRWHVVNVDHEQGSIFLGRWHPSIVHTVYTTCILLVICCCCV